MHSMKTKPTIEAIYDAQPLEIREMNEFHHKIEDDLCNGDWQ